MKPPLFRTFVVSALVAGLLTVLAAPEGGAQDVPPQERELYLRVMSAHFDLPSGEAQRLLEGGLAADELPLVLFLSRESGIAAPAVVAMRRGGSSWMNLARRAGLGADRFHVEIPEASVDARTSRMHRLFRDTPRSGWGALELTDEELVTLVHLRVFSRYFSAPVARVLEVRGDVSSWVGVPLRLAGGRR
jgi:hypothetical protein